MRTSSYRILFCGNPPKSIVRELVRRGNEIHLLEENCMKDLSTDVLHSIDVAIVISGVPELTRIARHLTENFEGVLAFYEMEYHSKSLPAEWIPRFDLYLSASGGGSLRLMETRYGSPKARPLYPCIDPYEFYPEEKTPLWDLGYIGDFSREKNTEEFLFDAAWLWREGRFALLGKHYPSDLGRFPNMEILEDLQGQNLIDFYHSERFHLSLARKDLAKSGYSPERSLFEAAACAVPMISNYWVGLEAFFEPGTEILIANNSEEVLTYLQMVTEEERKLLGRNAHKKVMLAHTSEVRVTELETYIRECFIEKSESRPSLRLKAL